MADLFDDFLNDFNDAGKDEPENTDAILAEQDTPVVFESTPEPFELHEIPFTVEDVASDRDITDSMILHGEFEDSEPAEMTAEEKWPEFMEVLNTPIGQDTEDSATEEIIEEESAAVEDTRVENPVEDEPLSPLQQAMLDLEIMSIQLEEEFSQEAENAIRRKINEAQAILDGFKEELHKFHDLRQVKKRAIREAEQRVSEEEHREAERRREAEVEKQRNSAMLMFKNRLAEIKPNWEQYAFKHQWDGAANLALHEGGLLADEMGLGKTMTSIMVPDMGGYKFNLVLTPNDTNSNFTIEYAQWAKHRWVWTLAGADKDTRKFFMGMVKDRVKNGQNVTLLMNYEQLYTDMDFFAELLEVPWDAVFIDEFHNAKNSKGLLFKRLESFRAAGVKRFFPITGTFILNSPDDIWTALHLVDPVAFPELRDFREHYCEQAWNGKWVFRTGGEASLLARLGGRITKRTMKEAGIVLPKQHIHFVPISFGEGYHDQRRIMRQLAEHSQIILDSDRKAAITAQIALITRQRQAAVWPAGITLSYEHPDTGEQIVFSVGDEVQESIKMDWTFEKLKELRAQGKRVAVFSQFKTALAALDKKLQEIGVRVVRYDGDTPRDIRAKVKRDFDRKHVEVTGEWEWDVVLCNFKTGGVGLNFTHATDMILLDEEWNPGKNEQAYKRIQRMGQTEETHVWIPQLQDSIDSWMREINEQKKMIIDGFESQVDLSQELTNFFNKIKDLY